VIELDGGQHALQGELDAQRTALLEAMGYLVLRFWNDDVLKNTTGVLEEILSTLNRHEPVSPHPDPFPKGEREKRS
jgi:very-short-patch-repair endonuclease